MLQLTHPEIYVDITRAMAIAEGEENPHESDEEEGDEEEGDEEEEGGEGEACEETALGQNRVAAMFSK